MMPFSVCTNGCTRMTHRQLAVSSESSYSLAYSRMVYVPFFAIYNANTPFPRKAHFGGPSAAVSQIFLHLPTQESLYRSR